MERLTAPAYQCADCLSRSDGRLADGTPVCSGCAMSRAERIEAILGAEAVRRQPSADAWYVIYGHPWARWRHAPLGLVAIEAELPPSRVRELLAASAPWRERTIVVPQPGVA